MPELYLLTWLVVQIFAPPVIEGSDSIFAFQLKPMFFADQILCIRAIRQGKKYNIWKNSALVHGLTNGTIVKVMCSPYIYTFTVTR